MDEVMSMDMHRVRPAIVITNIEADRGTASDTEQRFFRHTRDAIDCPDFPVLDEFANIHFPAFESGAAHATHGTTLH